MLKSSCPACGEPIRLIVDTSAGDQEYTEDCEVCCRPLVVTVSIAGSDIALDLRPE